MDFQDMQHWASELSCLSGMFIFITYHQENFFLAGSIAGEGWVGPHNWTTLCLYHCAWCGYYVVLKRCFYNRFLKHTVEESLQFSKELPLELKEPFKSIKNLYKLYCQFTSSLRNFDMMWLFYYLFSHFNFSFLKTKFLYGIPQTLHSGRLIYRVYIKIIFRIWC